MNCEKKIIIFWSVSCTYNFLNLVITQSRGRKMIVTSLTIPIPANMFPNKFASKVPKNPPFCSFASFLMVFVTSFNKKLESSKLERFTLCHSFLHLRLLKLLFLNHAFSFKFRHQLLKQQLLFLIVLKYVLPKEQLLSLMDLLIYN